MSRAAVLAMDGGNSKVDAALIARDGTVLGAKRLFRSIYEGLNGSLDSASAAVKAAFEDAGIDPDALASAEVGVYCVAGVDLPGDRRRIARLVAKRGWTGETIVQNDVFAVLRAGTEQDWGVAVVCGAGMNCAGVTPDGRIVRFPALGPISGDWGGGSSIGAAAQWSAIRARDGRGPRTSLERAVPTYFGLASPRAVMEAVHLNRMDWDRLIELTPVVFAEAKKGDAVARGIVDRQADEVIAMAGAAIRRLRMTELDVDVVLGGGIFRNQDDVFMERIGEGIRATAPRAKLRRVIAPPVVGAALLGLDELGTTARAAKRLRATLTHERLTAETSRVGKE